MGTWKRVLGTIALGVLLLPATACGNSTSSPGASDIQVDDITSPFAVFVSTPFTITGANFLSVVGTDATVRFTATGGVTPFAGGTSATTDVPGTVTSNTQVTGMSPTSAFVGSFSAYVTVILPSTASGTSATPIAEFIGVATDAVDDAYDGIGNTRLTRDAATGVLVNDDPTGFTTVIGFDAVSTNGGDVAVAPDGAFTYDPPAGFEGIDTFTYEISGGIGTDTATVTRHGRRDGVVPRRAAPPRAATAGSRRRSTTSRRSRRSRAAWRSRATRSSSTGRVARPTPDRSRSSRTRSCWARAWTSWWAARPS